MADDACMSSSNLLDSHVHVREYDIHLKPNFDTFRFEGLSKIALDITDPTKVINLHAKELAISAGVTLECPSNGKTYNSESIAVSEKNTTCTFCFAEELPVGPAVLTVDFVGTLNDQMAGLYRSAYVDQYGKSKHLLCTQMEAIDARRAFPCIDEPSAKAVFRITVTTEAHRQVISNMPEASRALFAAEHSGSLMQRVTFMASPLMSPYLMALVVGEFEFLQSSTQRGTLVRVLATPGRKDQCHFALDTATRVLEWYEKFFGLPYPLPKLDLVAIPDFACGAMENWGLVTFREVDLLCDPAKVSVGTRKRVATVVCHELAHQWFGNLVTMQWWDDLWLNEGFATFMENLSADALFPDLGLWNMYVSSDLESAFHLDGMRSSHPIKVPISAAEDVDEVFDAISYEKGCAIVRTLWAVLGGEVFQKGVQIYMQRHQYKNTQTSDLWQAFEEASGQPVKEMMDSWTDQMGYPVLEVGPRDSNGNCRVAQSWFLSDGSVKEGDEEKKWVVPILVGDDKTPSGEMGRLTMMREKSETINVGNGKWALLNYGAWVPYRVHYSSPEMRVALAEAVADRSLPVPDRIQLLATVRALAKARHLTVCEALQLLTYYKNEDDADVWDAIAIAVSALDPICIGVGRGKEMNRLVSDLIEGPLARVGWDSKPTDESKTRQLRSTFVRLASKYCHTNTQMVDTACQRAQAYLEDPASLPADIRSSVLKLALAGGGDFWTALRERAERYDITKTEVVDIYSSLGYVRDRRLKQRTLEWSLDPVVRPSDYYTVMASVRTSSSEGADMAWDFLVTRFDDVKGRVSTACSSLLTSVFYSCAGGSTDSSRADILEHLRVEKKLNAIGRSLSQLIESIRSNAAAVEHARDSNVTKDAFWSELFAMLRN
ncbi:Puromycin-sensitive aminopeptidase, putative [Perkinsus marinus ATCC 50983]|uniref:Aminopeptidase n=1 Tax=Perkinsus marinus (strain ATCC 50983 / TXsc) TaxID=423536 RepID=C5KXI9_PERM5|nr:Puromycin-sensitive aminopeptidase, putative [Perkinsus marinus ATCC 50983]EER10713.1 Puromycin-sensitive aminopeptidase, putative [Perkinsus marinus ATCC 50983]|eukprot:XP_002778918.1 Puromycin-sensitive aminopeptidase, putative [Perkinsus marinus ATCC 50983]